MQVVELPDSGPTLWTEHTRYEPGDVLRANCTSQPSRPKAELTLTLNNMVVSLHIARRITNHHGQSDLEQSHLTATPAKLALRYGADAGTRRSVRIRWRTVAAMYRHHREAVRALHRAGAGRAPAGSNTGQSHLVRRWTDIAVPGRKHRRVPKSVDADPHHAGTGAAQQPSLISPTQSTARPARCASSKIVCLHPYAVMQCPAGTDG
uniref:Uncharacterized protein n=1 Tax=Anopheles arabiensis TaxID=7173 RepID=A0A2C9GPM7_ANOAR